MEASDLASLLASIGLVLANMFFVAAEYSLVGCRKSHMQALSRRGNRWAAMVVQALDRIHDYVAGIQIAITMCGVGAGSITEPYLTALLRNWFGAGVDRRFSFALAFLLVTYVIVVVGELLPKYLTLRASERVALAVIGPLRVVVTILKPVIFVFRSTGTLLLRLFGVRIDEETKNHLTREELLLLLRSQHEEGAIEVLHAGMVAKALRLDRLDAADIMVHRLDIQWVDVDTPKDKVLAEVRRIPHSRFPVCRNDVDEVVGIVYLHDVVRQLDLPDFSLERIARPAVMVPETLTLDKAIGIMREERTQILIVADEYGGTSGLITLEDIVDEVFGELEDSLESEQEAIRLLPGGRISARAEVRFDEIVEKLGIELEEEPGTETLATLMVNSLERVPRLGDTVDTPLGVMRIENMARNRITRLSIQLSQSVRAQANGEA